MVKRLCESGLFQRDVIVSEDVVRFPCFYFLYTDLKTGKSYTKQFKKLFPVSQRFS